MVGRVLLLSFLFWASLSPAMAEPWGGDVGAPAPAYTPPDPPLPPPAKTAEKALPVSSEEIPPQAEKETQPPVAAPQMGGSGTLPPDVCAAYMNSYEAYTICQDRMQKIQRMIDARKERATRGVLPPLIAPPAATTPTTPPAAPVAEGAGPETKGATTAAPNTETKTEQAPEKNNAFQKAAKKSP